MKVFQVRQSIWWKCAIRLTLILKSAQARCELESLEMYFVHLKDLLWSYGNYNICKWYFISRCSSSFKEFRNFWLQFSKTNKPITNNEYAPFRKKGLKILPGWNFFEAESFSGLKVSQLFSGLKVSPDWKFLEAESFSGLKVSQLFSGLKVSPDWKFLPAESFSRPQVSRGWNCRNWKCLRAESVFHPHGWKCLAAENVWAANFLRWKLSQGWKCLLDLWQTKLIFCLLAYFAQKRDILEPKTVQKIKIKLKSRTWMTLKYSLVICISGLRTCAASMTSTALNNLRGLNDL